MANIVQKDASVLREKAALVPTADITSARIAKVIKSMKEALDSQADGVAIAAPQIGESLRIFVVTEKVFELSHEAAERREKAKEKPSSAYNKLVFINPQFVKCSREKEWLEEGCLSVRWLYGKVNRSVKATIKAYDENGNKIVRGASGLLAQVFQHEIDHLEGVLFIDKAKEVREMNPETT